LNKKASSVYRQSAGGQTEGCAVLVHFIGIVVQNGVVWSTGKRFLQHRKASSGLPESLYGRAEKPFRQCERGSSASRNRLSRDTVSMKRKVRRRVSD